MIIGVPREIKEAENRVAMVPAGVDVLVADGHRDDATLGVIHPNAVAAVGGQSSIEHHLAVCIDGGRIKE